MKKVLPLILISLIFTSCMSRERNLTKALTWDKNKEDILATFPKLAEYTGADKEKVIVDTLGENNLTHWLITLKEDDYSSFDINFMESGAAKAVALATKLSEDATFVRYDEIENLKYKKYSKKYELGIFTVNNSCLKGKFVFLSDNSDNGKVVKMVVPKKGTEEIKDGLVVFDIIK